MIVLYFAYHVVYEWTLPHLKKIVLVSDKRNRWWHPDKGVTQSSFKKAKNQQKDFVSSQVNSNFD